MEQLRGGTDPASTLEFFVTSYKFRYL